MLKIAFHAVPDDFQMQLAHPADNRLARLFVGPCRKCRILPLQLVEHLASFLRSALDSGSTAIEITVSGNRSAPGTICF